MSIRISNALASTAIIVALMACPASATAVRTFVSGKGADSGSCSLIAPCRTFAFALNATTDGGEIVVLDSAGYGAVTIGKPVTISNQTGVEGGITVNSGDGITINLSTAGTVTLKGLTIDGGGTANNGINVMVSVPSTVNIASCTVRNFSGIGLQVVSTATNVKMLISDSGFVGNGGDGILIYPQNNSVIKTDISRSVVAQNIADGIEFKGGAGVISATLTEVTATQNLSHGIATSGSTGGSFQVVLRNSIARDSGSTDVQNDFSGPLVDGWAVYLLQHNFIGVVNTNPSAWTWSDQTNDVQQWIGPHSTTDLQ